MSPETVEAICYTKILLQEIAQGYDNGNYRMRVLRCLSTAKITLPGTTAWVSRNISTTEFLRQLERVIEVVFASKTTTDQ